MYNDLIVHLIKTKVRRNKWSPRTGTQVSGKDPVSLLLYSIYLPHMICGVAVTNSAQLREGILNKLMSPPIGPPNYQLHGMIQILNPFLIFEQCLDHVFVESHQL